MKALENVVLFQVDAEKGEGPELKESYSVSGYPNFVLANSGAVTMDRWIGYRKEHFLTNLEDALSDPTTIEEKRARFESHPTPKDAGKLGRFHATRGEYRDAVAMYEKAGSLGGGDYSFEIFENTAYGVKGEHFTLDEAHAAAKAVFASESQVAKNLVDCARTMMWLGRRHESLEMAVGFLEPAMAAAKEDPELESSYRRLEIDHALLVEKDKEKALELKYADMPEGWKDDHGQLNGFSWWCFENSVNLEEAEVLARRGVELAPPGAERAAILDTVAEICNARGNCDDAVALIRRAIEDDPNRESYRKQLSRFEAILAAQAN